MSPTAHATPTDPYRNFKFRVKWQGRYIAGVTRVSGLRRTTEVVAYREAGAASHVRKLPGVTKFEPVVLERGITHDTEFEAWANAIETFESGLGPRDFRRDVRIELLNESGQVVTAYVVRRCWVSEYQALPDLDANANAVAIERIRLENEGWERDAGVVPPADASRDEP
jgi:phage tail-like protein